MPVQKQTRAGQRTRFKVISFVDFFFLIIAGIVIAVAVSGI